MGRRRSPETCDGWHVCRPVRTCIRKTRGILAIPAAIALCLGFGLSASIHTTGTAEAQTLSERLAKRSKSSGPASQQDQMVVDAKELVYDSDKETVSATGNVQIYYRGRILQADKVNYNRATKRVYAEGRLKLTEPDGTVAYGTRAELTDDFRDGFIDSLRAKSADNTHFTARRSERSKGDTTVFFNGTYTACEACKKDPSKPPLWRVRAKRIIHKNEEQMIYYEDAVFELWGYPIAYLPYFSTPDPSVKRKSGFLIPSYIARSRLGVGASVPYFWALAPHYDLTLTPAILSRQGFLGQAQWRHRLVNGSYEIRATGIFQNDPGAFLNPPYGPGDRHFRGSVESTGKFHINKKWQIGWDINLLSDRWFKQDYRLPAQSLSQNYFRDSISTVYLTGQGPRGFFDLRGYYFQGLSRSDIQSQQPIVAPVLDYNKSVDLDPKRTAGIGGNVTVDFNFVNITRDLASYEAIGGRRLDRAFGLYDVCESPRSVAGVALPPGTPTYNRLQCLVRGMAGNYSRATFNVEWKRKYIDPLGQVWTPFVFAHLNGSWLNLDATGSKFYANPGCATPPCTSLISNAFQNVFFSNTGTTFRGVAAPGAGLEYRFPFIAATNAVVHVLEPIAQLIVRPNEPRDSFRVNEDAQSLVFDDTSLFSRSKYSGYDRFEGGTRVNYGLKYSATFRNGGYADLMVGQSFQLAGRNSYSAPDAANVGLGSGLERKYSDVVARASFAPNSLFNFVAKTRFDPDSMKLRRVDLVANMNVGRFQGTLQYARYDAQPLIGFDKTREGLLAGAKLQLSKNIAVNSSVIFDLSRHLYNNPVNYPTLGRAPLFSIAGLGLGASYHDECTTLAVRYTSILEANGTGKTVRNQTVLVSLQLRTVGDTKIRSSLGATTLTDTANAGLFNP